MPKTEWATKEMVEGKCRTVVVPPSSPDKENQNSNWLKSKKAAWNNVLGKMRLHSSTLTHRDTKSLNQLHQRMPLSEPPLPKPSSKTLQNVTLQTPDPPVSDGTSLLSDALLLNILSKLPKSDMNSSSLVSKRWLDLQGRLVSSIKLFDWDFLVSGRLFSRFPNLSDVDLVNSCLVSPRNSGIFCTHKSVSFHVGSEIDVDKVSFFDEHFLLTSDEIDRGLMVLANRCPNLRRLAVINCSELGLLSVAEECPSLQELDLLMCNDHVLRGIAAYRNLQVLRLTGIVEGFYRSMVSDIGLTILAQGCKHLIKLELNGCSGSYEGIKAIGQCCQMLQELTLCNHKMEDGWLLALPYCESLWTLRLVSCKAIDRSSELNERYWGSCLGIERLHLEKCQLRDRRAMRALFLVCCGAREVTVKDCWGLNDDVFATATFLSKVRSLTLEGCSMLTMHGLESVVVSWNELQSLKVTSCNNVKDCEVNPALSGVFSGLKDLQWKPDTKSMISGNLEGAGMRKRGNKFFKKACDWKSLPGA